MSPAAGFQMIPTPTTVQKTTNTAISVINLISGQMSLFPYIHCHSLGILYWVLETAHWPTVMVLIGRRSLCPVLHHSSPCEASHQQTSIKVWPWGTLAPYQWGQPVYGPIPFVCCGSKGKLQRQSRSGSKTASAQWITFTSTHRLLCCKPRQAIT